MNWVENVKSWTGLPMESAVRATGNREEWRMITNPRIKDGWGQDWIEHQMMTYH